MYSKTKGRYLVSFKNSVSHPSVFIKPENMTVVLGTSSAAASESFPDEYYCPISLDLMKDPENNNSRDLGVYLIVAPIIGAIELLGYDFTGVGIMVQGTWTGVDHGNIYESGFYKKWVKPFKKSNVVAEEYNTVLSLL